MSLSKAPQDISSHPSKGSVSAPVNKRDKDADVERKMRLYGVVDALRHHKLPSNAQIDDALRYVLDSSPSSLDSLSSEGKRMIQGVKDVIATFRYMVMEKNADEMIQDLTWRLSSAGSPFDRDIPAGKSMGDQGDRDEAVKHLRTLLTLVLTNSEVRKLLSDFSIVGRDLLSLGAGKAATAIAPSKAALDNVNKPAPENEFVTEGGRKIGPHETPILEGHIPGVGGMKAHPKDDAAEIYREEGGEQRSTGKFSGTGDAKGKATEMAGGLMQGMRDKMGGAQGAKEKVAGMRDQGMQQGHELQQSREAGDDDAIQAKKGGMKGKMRQFRDNVKDNMPGQSKDKANEIKGKANERKQRAKSFFSDEYFPKERRDQFIFRGKKVLLECQNHDDYQGSMKWLISFVERYVQHGLSTAGTSKRAAHDMDPNLKYVLAELRTLLERFANGNSMSVVTDAIDALVDDSRRDPDLRYWFQESSEYLKKVLLVPGYVMDERCGRQGEKLRVSGSRFYDDKYRDHFSRLFDSVGSWFSGMREDPINRQFGKDWSNLAKDLLFDTEGNLKFKPELWHDIRKVILPAIIDQVGYVPIPRVEYTDDSLDLVIENLTLQGRNMFPNIVAMETNNYVKFSPYASIPDMTQHHVKVHLQQIQADMRDVAFYYRKKTGLPRMKDSGIADVVLGGTGLSATVELVSSNKDPSSMFKVRRVHVKVDSLKFSIRESKHDFLYKTLGPLATGLIKRQIEKVVGDGLRTFFEYIDGSLVSVKGKVGEGMKSDNKGEALRQIFSQTKQGKEEPPPGTSPSHSQFKVVSNKRDSLFAGQGHPSGWVNRTAEMQDMARGEVGGQPISSSGGILSSAGGASRGHGVAVGGHPSMEPDEWKSEAFTMQDDGTQVGHQPRRHSQSHPVHSKKHVQVQQNIAKEKARSGAERVVDSAGASQRYGASHN